MNKIKTFILVLIFLIITGCSKNELKEYKKSFNYFNSDINIKLYTSSNDKADIAFKEIEKIYKTYENLIDRNDIDSEISYIYNNTSNDKKIKISENMNNLIEYGINLYNDSNGFLSINTGSLYDLWDKGIPSNNESKHITTDINKIKINNNVMDNNHVNLSFNQFIKGYINKLIKEYLKKMNINYYFINTESEVLAGKNINNEDYIVAISSPFNNEVLKVFNIQDKYIVTKSIYHNSYEYDGKLYSSIVNAKGKTMANNMISVTVLSDDIYTGELVSNLLFINDYYDGIDIANKYNVEVIWCFKDKLGNEVIKKKEF